MLRCLAVGLALGVALWPSLALAQVDGELHTPGNACDHGATASHGNAPDWDTFFECNGSSQWQRGPYFLGATSDSCDSNHAGMVQWTGSSVSPNNTFEFCNGSTWITVNGVASSVPLNGITAATGSTTIDSGANAQIWKWGTLSTGTALTLTTSSMTGGTLLSLQDTAAASTSTGYVLSVTDATTGTGYGVYSAMTATANTGYAGYFTNASGGGYGIYALETTSTGGTGTTGPGAAIYAGENNNVNSTAAVFATNNSPNGYGVVALNTSTTGFAAGIYASSASNNGTGIYGTAGNGTAVYGNGYEGVYGHSPYVGAGYGVYGDETGATNTGYAGYFTNTSASGWSLYAGTAPSYFAGPVGIVTSSPGSGFNGVGNATTPSLQVVDGDQGFVIGGDGGAQGTLTNNTGKAARISMPNYANAQEPVGLIVGFANGSNSSQVIIGGGTSLVDAATEIDFYTAANATTSGGTQRMIINSSGFVGIGTTTPTYGLTLAQNGGTAYQTLFVQDATSSTGRTHFVLKAGAGQGNNDRIFDIQDASGNTLARSDSVGNFGVYSIGDVNAATPFIDFNVAGQMTFAVRNSTDVFAFNGGSVGIGTTSPQAALDVNGAARVGSTGASCSSTNAGAVQYTSGTLEACNGTSWIPIDSGMHFISTQTASSSASLQFTNLPTSYNTLFLNCAGLVPSANGTNIYLYVGEGSTPTWETGAHYSVAGEYWNTANTGSNLTTTTASDALYNGLAPVKTTFPVGLLMYINNVGSSTIYKMMTTKWTGGYNYLFLGSVGAYWNNDTNPITAIELSASSGNLTSGTCSLYGMN